MNIFEPLNVQQSQVDAANQQAQVAYDVAVGLFRQQVADYQQRAQDQWDKTRTILAPPVVPLKHQYAVVGGIMSEVEPVNAYGLTAPVFTPVAGKSGSAIAASAAVAGPSVTDMLARLDAQNIAIYGLLQEIKRAVVK